MPVNPVLKVRYDWWLRVLDRKLWIEYLQPPPEAIHDLEDIFIKAHSPVINVIQEHVKTYMTEGKEPPAAISTVVMNFADDIVSGRTPVLRAGDYIAVRNFAKQQHAS